MVVALAQWKVNPRKALDVCSTVFSSQTLRLNLYQFRTRNPVREGAGVVGCELVGREHLHDHLVVAGVGVERFHDPVPPSPDMRLALADLRAIAIPVAIAPNVHPVPCPALTVLGTAQKAIDDPLVGVGAGSLTNSRTSAGEGASPVRSRVTLRSKTSAGAADRPEAAGLVLDSEEGVNRIADPGGILGLRDRRPHGR